MDFWKSSLLPGGQSLPENEAALEEKQHQATPVATI